MTNYDKIDRESIWKQRGWIPDFDKAELYHIVSGRSKKTVDKKVRSIMEQGLKPSEMDPIIYENPEWVNNSKSVFFSPKPDSTDIKGAKLKVVVNTENLWVDALQEQVMLEDYFKDNKNMASRVYGNKGKNNQNTNTPNRTTPDINTVVPMSYYSAVYEDIGDSLWDLMIGILKKDKIIHPNRIEKVGYELTEGMK